MKTNYIKYLIIGLFSLVVLNCSEESCDFDEDCVPVGQNIDKAGFTVTTFYTDLPNDFVGAVYDTRNNSAAPLGNDWGVPLGSSSKTIHPTDWTRAKLGAVFGIATDEIGNVFLASSGVYNQEYNPSTFLPPYTNPNPGRIYKATSGTYSTSTFVDLPVTMLSTPADQLLNGIGNIAYDKANKQLFATNLDDGKIYRISSSGTIQSDKYDPWSPDVAAPGIVTQDERIWGIGVNYENGKVKLYFARLTVSKSRNIYSITLNPDGSLPTSAVPSLEISNVPGDQSSITDIEFSADTNKMIIAERGRAHEAISTSYNRSGTVWISNLFSHYYVGGLANGRNSAGGADFQYEGDDRGIKCKEFVWVSGNYMVANALPGSILYGIQGIKYSGNSFLTSKSTDWFIDFDPPLYIWNHNLNRGKGEIGDVDTFDADACFCLKK